ncbi:universal stress protein [Fulvivirga sedimenti]|uniref:Universal stress protein n=1 Tax=Fulvivirga sedimenti TaxID=2879465 RepID=A0A9X1KVA5_9BACT|nr:universal stress protein [Fulvivirga sedimenti]MCA6074538.1 universal stress protein [Fulvivirga sedimenti]MCA6075715.1 universal stress protein [Fulvivirga sedimenti]MCA6076843.1 universal stress protein [Fulvivirga sedimenti]
MDAQRILVPVDFSRCSMNALNSAVHISKHLKSELILFYVKQEMILQDNEHSHFEDDLLDPDLEKKFKRLQKEISDLRNIPHRHITRLGEVDKEIARLAAEEEADLIIMGTKGTSGIYEVLMGSNAYSVVRTSKIPVLVIPQGSQIDEIHHVALAGDYKPIMAEMLEPVKLLAGIDGADIHIVHVGESANLNEKEKTEAMKYDRYLKNYRHHYHLIVGTDVEESLNDYCSKKNIDILAMIPRKHKLFDRVFDGGETKNMVFHTDIPLLAIPE